jgi:hypothetical protein
MLSKLKIFTPLTAKQLIPLVRDNKINCYQKKEIRAFIN